MAAEIEELILEELPQNRVYQKFVNILPPHNDNLFSLCNDIIENNYRFLWDDQMYNVFKLYVGNESLRKISKEDYMELAGLAYDRFILNRSLYQAQEISILQVMLLQLIL